MHKRQPTGHMELRKCVEEMKRLKEKIADCSVDKQYRAVTGRMITDLEMNSTTRGAVEIFNLIINMRKDDVLFAECTCTFPTRVINAREWLHQLEIETGHRKVGEYVCLVPATRKPYKRTARSRAVFVDAYGFRPMVESLALLCPFEFVMFWCCAFTFAYRLGGMQRDSLHGMGVGRSGEVL